MNIIDLNIAGRGGYTVTEAAMDAAMAKYLPASPAQSCGPSSRTARAWSTPRS